MGEYAVIILITAGIMIVGLLLRAFEQSKSGSTSARTISLSRDDKSGPLYHWPSMGNFDFEVVGESFYQKALTRLAGQHDKWGADTQCVATLVPEDLNQHDPKAVAVFVDGQKVAYLSREDARRFRRRLGGKKIAGSITTCDAVIVGGGSRKSGDALLYGIKLDLKPFN